MDNARLRTLTARQFARVLEREGKDVIDYYSGQTVRVLFRKSVRGIKSNESVTIYYPQDSILHKGSMFTYGDRTYIINNRDGLESNVYYTSGCLYCNSMIMIDDFPNDARAVKRIPFSTSEFHGTQSGSTIMVISGKMTAITQDCSGIRAVKVNDELYIANGTFKVINVYANDGIFYTFLEQTTNQPSQSYYTIIDEGYPTEFDIDDTYNFTAKEYFLGEETYSNITWSSSNTDIAEITETGHAIFKKGGLVRFKATAKNSSAETDYISVEQVVTGHFADITLSDRDMAVEYYWSSSYTDLARRHIYMGVQYGSRSLFSWVNANGQPEVIKPDVKFEVLDYYKQNVIYDHDTVSKYFNVEFEEELTGNNQYFKIASVIGKEGSNACAITSSVTGYYDEVGKFLYDCKKDMCNLRITLLYQGQEYSHENYTMFMGTNLSKSTTLNSKMYFETSWYEDHNTTEPEVPTPEPENPSVPAVVTFTAHNDSFTLPEIYPTYVNTHYTVNGVEDTTKIPTLSIEVYDDDGALFWDKTTAATKFTIGATGDGTEFKIQFKGKDADDYIDYIIKIYATYDDGSTGNCELEWTY